MNTHIEQGRHDQPREVAEQGRQAWTGEHGQLVVTHDRLGVMDTQGRQEETEGTASSRKVEEQGRRKMARHLARQRRRLPWLRLRRFMTRLKAVLLSLLGELFSDKDLARFVVIILRIAIICMFSIPLYNVANAYSRKTLTRDELVNRLLDSENVLLLFLATYVFVLVKTIQNHERMYKAATEQEKKLNEYIAHIEREIELSTLVGVLRDASPLPSDIIRELMDFESKYSRFVADDRQRELNEAACRVCFDKMFASINLLCQDARSIETRGDAHKVNLRGDARTVELCEDVCGGERLF